MPNLVIDEVILLVDTYFKIKTKTESPNLLIMNLSSNLKQMPFFPEFRGREDFPNENGMRIMLQSLSFFQNGRDTTLQPSKMQRRVYEYYCCKQELFHSIYQSIISVAKENNDCIHINDPDFIGGSILYNKHLEIEKEDISIKHLLVGLRQQQRFECGICGKDLSITYGDYAMELLEIHYSFPLGSYRSEMNILPKYAVSICPCCHKLAHNDLLTFEEENLREIINN